MYSRRKDENGRKALLRTTLQRELPFFTRASAASVHAYLKYNLRHREYAGGRDFERDAPGAIMLSVPIFVL